MRGDKQDDRLLCRFDFVIRLGYDGWRRLTEEGRRALLDHELMHCAPKLDKDGEWIGWTLRSHDIGEFGEIVKRRGLWHQDLEEFGERVRQLELIPTGAAD